MRSKSRATKSERSTGVYLSRPLPLLRGNLAFEWQCRVQAASEEQIATLAIERLARNDSKG